MRSLDDLTLFAYGLLDECAERETAAHVAGCPECADLVKRLSSERRLLKGAFARETPELPAWALYPWP